MVFQQLKDDMPCDSEVTGQMFRGNFFVESVFLLAPGATVQRTEEMGKIGESAALSVSEKHREL